MASAVAQPVAQVLVDVGARQVDRPFDYLVPESLADAAVVGARVRVRFSGRLVNGFILARRAASEHGGELREIVRVLGPAVLTDEIAQLTREVAQTYLGTWSDVMRSAIPPRHVEAEKLLLGLPVGESEWAGRPLDAQWSQELERCIGGQRMLERLVRRAAVEAGSPAQTDPTRVAFTISPSVDAEQFLAGLVAAMPGTSLVLAPDSRSIGRIRQAFTRQADVSAPRVEVLDSADSPRNRYTAFLKVLRGEADIVIGTRDAVFAPLRNLDRIIVWDEGSEHYRDQRSPSWHARRVAMMRSLQVGCDLVLAGYSRSLEVAQLVESGWLKSIELPQDLRRENTAEVVTEAAARGDDAPGARIPGIAWRAIKRGVELGPVLVSVPRAGYVRFLACAECEEALECRHCGGVLEQASANDQISCAVCAQVVENPECVECGSSKLKMATIGASRIVEELKRAFPRTTIVESSAKEGVLARVSAEPQIVVATTGAEPVAEGRFQASVVLDGRFSLLRTDLDAGESAIHRWMSLLAGTKSAANGGTLVLTGNPANRIVQAVLRMDPNGWSKQELRERAELGLPPAKRFVELSAPPNELAAFVELARPALASIPDAQIVNSLPRENTAVALVTVPLTASRAMAQVMGGLIHDWFGVTAKGTSTQAAETRTGSHQLRVEVDPVRL